MKIQIHDNAILGHLAAAAGADILRSCLKARKKARFVVATGTSQFNMLAALVNQPKIDWNRTIGYHLDEYIGLPIWHNASFRRYLWLRFVSQLPVPLLDFHWINGEEDPLTECDRLEKCIGKQQIDVAFIGIGENGHLAFNDPPADFSTEKPFIRVSLDEACRKQQVEEGWFDHIGEVPAEAISMSIPQIMKARHIICTVPDARKAEAVRAAVNGPVTPDVPASILQQHPSCQLFLDKGSASLLKS
jgi:glucosamine-6-phosphate deaminase